MGILDLDFEGVDTGSGYTLVSAGDHGFAITKCDDKTDEARPHVIYTLTCNDGSPSDGATLQYRLYFEEKSMPFAKRFLQHVLGVSIEGKLSNYVSDFADLVGYAVEGVVDHNANGSKIYANLNAFSLSQPED